MTLTIDDLQLRVPSAKVAEPLARHTTWAIGGPADVYAEPKTLDELRALEDWSRTRGLPLTPIGAGSNLLVGDHGVRGVVFRLRGDFEKLTMNGHDVVAGAGVFLPTLARTCADAGLDGAAAFAGIPGTLGGGLMTNAGTGDGDLGSLVTDVTVMEPGGATTPLNRDQLSFRYRGSNLQGRLVVGARLTLRPGDRAAILARTQALLKKRAETQPLGTFNCGSVFKNPPGDHAARLIEAAGLKGRRLGGVRVSPKHANFIENVDHATAADARALMGLIRDTVRETFGVTLEPEVWSLGE